jgi:hypothetical protein
MNRYRMVVNFAQRVYKTSHNELLQLLLDFSSS